MAEVPEEYGGLGLSVLGIAGMNESRSYLGPLASTVFAHQGIGTLPLINFGTQAQIDKYLASCMDGTTMAAFALTEPSSSSDTTSRVDRMDIGVPFRSLGRVDMEALGAAILAQDDIAWNENVQRQKDYEVHEQTRSIVLLFANVEEWPAVEVSRQPGWDRLSDVAVPVMHEIIRNGYPPGGTIIRAMAAKLLAGGRIIPHRDSHPSFGAGHRIHVPIVTNPRVRFMIDGRPFQFEIGQAYEINNQKVHSVMNKGAADRINFIFDYVPPGALPARAASARAEARRAGS
jgi:hypothetical protein